MRFGLDLNQDGENAMTVMIRRVAVMTPYVILASIAAIVLPPLGTRYEAGFSPILVNSRVWDIRLEEHDLCWKWSWVKVRPAAPVAIRFYLSAGPSADIPIIVVRKPGQYDVVKGPIERPLGPFTVDLCTNLDGLPGYSGPLTVRGYGEYTVEHGLWTVRQVFPTVTYTLREKLARR